MKVLLHKQDLNKVGQNLYDRGYFKTIKIQDVSKRCIDQVMQADTIKLLLPDMSSIEISK